MNKIFYLFFFNFRFLTTEEVEEEVKQSGIRALSYLQMPPVVKILQDEEKVISNDPALKDFSDSTYVFTDITFGLKNTQRKVIMRQIDGSLVTAPNSIRKRMNQIYFPLNGRKIRLPRMFEEEHLQKCLTDGKYDFILDRLCVQFEPFESDFHEISSKVYLHINENKKFDELRSTRHFGPMAFFFAWHKIIDDLIFDMIKRDYLRNCVELIVLMYKLNNIEENSGILEKLKDLPEINEFEKYKPFSSSMIENEIETSVGKSENDFKSDDICLEFIDNFVKENSIKKTQLELALQAYRETNEQKRQLFEGLNKAHGIN